MVSTPLGRIRPAASPSARTPSPTPAAHGSYIAPVYDYCMATEPLTTEQLASIGWAGRQGLSDIPNQFHYYRLTEDNRILWGGYDGVLLARQGLGRAGEPSGDVGDAQRALLRDVPAARGGPLQPHLGRSHRRAPGSACSGARRWAGRWPTPSATPASASPRRFGAEVMLDLLGRRSVATARTSCARKPLPFPPSRSAAPASRRHAGLSIARIAPASATSGCARSTDSSSGSTHSVPSDSGATCEPHLAHTWPRNRLMARVRRVFRFQSVGVAEVTTRSGDGAATSPETGSRRWPTWSPKS